MWRWKNGQVAAPDKERVWIRDEMDVGYAGDMASAVGLSSYFLENV